MPQREIAIAQQQRDAAALERLAHLHVVGIGDVHFGGGVRSVAQFLHHSQQPLHAFAALAERIGGAHPGQHRQQEAILGPAGESRPLHRSIAPGAPSKSRQTPPACAPSRPPPRDWARSARRSRPSPSRRCAGWRAGRSSGIKYALRPKSSENTASMARGETCAAPETWSDSGAPASGPRLPVD